MMSRRIPSNAPPAARNPRVDLRPAGKRATIRRLKAKHEAEVAAGDKLREAYDQAAFQQVQADEHKRQPHPTILSHHTNCPTCAALKKEEEKDRKMQREVDRRVHRALRAQRFQQIGRAHV